MQLVLKTDLQFCHYFYDMFDGAFNRLKKTLASDGVLEGEFML